MNLVWKNSERVKGRVYPFFGFALGDYIGTCHKCKERFLGDKRSYQCQECAEDAQRESIATFSIPLREFGDPIL